MRSLERLGKLPDEGGDYLCVVGRESHRPAVRCVQFVFWIDSEQSIDSSDDIGWSNRIILWEFAQWVTRSNNLATWNSASSHRKAKNSRPMITATVLIYLRSPAKFPHYNNQSVIE